MRISRGTNKASIILVGNKIDVGGSAVPTEDIKRFSERIGANRYYTTSAMIGKGVKELLEGISGAVEWSELLKSFNEKIGVSIGEYIKKKSKERKIERRIELIKSILNDFKGTDELEVNAILNYYISQAIIQISKNEEYIILDPEYVDKRIGKIISEASERDGVIEITRMLSFFLFPCFFCFFGVKLKSFFGVFAELFFWGKNRKKENFLTII